MGSDADRNRQRPFRLKGALHEQPHVVGGYDIDAGQVLFLDHEAVNPGVDPDFGIAGDDGAGALALRSGAVGLLIPFLSRSSISRYSVAPIAIMSRSRVRIMPDTTGM